MGKMRSKFCRNDDRALTIRREHNTAREYSPIFYTVAERFEAYLVINVIKSVTKFSLRRNELSR